MMMRSEDVIHGTHIGVDPGRNHMGINIVGRPRPGGESKAVDERKRASQEALVEAEHLVEHEEPYSIDDSIIKEDDAQVRAYMEVWDHYQSAYNAVMRRNSADLYIQWILEMMEAILGRKVAYDVAENDPPVTRMIWEAGQERSRLLSQIERNQETLGVQADSIASQQRLIQEQSKQAAQGKRAFDAFMLLAVRLGINPAPTDPEEFSNAVHRMFIREENERDEALNELRDLYRYAGGSGDETVKGMAAHIHGAISS